MWLAYTHPIGAHIYPSLPDSIAKCVYFHLPMEMAKVPSHYVMLLPNVLNRQSKELYCNYRMKEISQFKRWKSNINLELSIMGAETHTINYRPRDEQKISNLTMNSGGKEDGMLPEPKSPGRVQLCEDPLASLLKVRWCLSKNMMNHNHKSYNRFISSLRLSETITVLIF